MITHKMTVGKLRNILESLETDMLLWPNALNNVAVLSSEDKYLGFIDFNEEMLFVNGDEEEDEADVCEDSGQFCEVCTCGGPRCNP